MCTDDSLLQKTAKQIREGLAKKHLWSQILAIQAQYQQSYGEDFSFFEWDLNQIQRKGNTLYHMLQDAIA